MTTELEKVKHLLTIQSVRERTKPIFKLGTENNLDYFDLDLKEIDEVVDFVTKVIKRDFGTNYELIPPHGRWGHLNAGGHKRVESLVEQWEQDKVSEVEIGKRLVDLFVFSVLIDAGAGNEWKYKELGTGEEYNRSEGLAIVSIDLFKQGKLSSDDSNPHQVNAVKLQEFTQAELFKSFQISETNPLSGAAGRLNLLQNLGKALSSNKELFGQDGRPGNLIEYLYKNSESGQGQPVIDLTLLWDSLMLGFTPIWPKGRTSIDGISLGDAWPLSTTRKLFDHEPEFIDTIIPFHKLTQWLSYSLLVPLKNHGYKFVIKNEDLQTGLPEYRNGGLFYDLQVLQLKPQALERGLKLSKEIESKTPEIPSFTPEDGVIVEWRALTIGLLDYLLPLVNKKLDYELSLPQLIEAGSWKSGREIAAAKRPSTKGPPIDLYSDGTVF